jgi:hypothetical protein
MDYSFSPLNSDPDSYILDFGYPPTPQYLDNNVIDLGKSQSAAVEVAAKKRRRVPQPLILGPAGSNQRKRSNKDDSTVEQMTSEEYSNKRPRLASEITSTPRLGPIPEEQPYESIPTLILDPTCQFQSDFTPYDNIMFYPENPFQYDQCTMPETSYRIPFPQEVFATPPVSPFESMGWYAPSTAYVSKPQQTLWNTPHTLPQQYPISPASTPQKLNDRPLSSSPAVDKINIAPQPQRTSYPPSPPQSAPLYNIPQQHLLPKLEPYGTALVVPPKKDKRGRKGKNGKGEGGMFINFTADDRETILSGVAPSGSSKSKKELKL